MDVPYSSCLLQPQSGTIDVLAIIANAIIVTSSVCLYQAWSRGVRAPLQREGCERPLMSDRLDLANYLPYLVNRSGRRLVENFTASALAQHDSQYDAWRVMGRAGQSGRAAPDRSRRHDEHRGLDLSRLITRMVRMGLSRAGARELKPRGRC